MRWSQLVVCAICVGTLQTRDALAAAGSVLQTYNWNAADFVSHPTQPIIYASVPALNSVAVINTNTLAATTVFIGSNPSGMAISPDGSRLYVANSGSSFVGVLDTTTNAALAPLQVSSNPSDVAFGNGNRLFVLAGGILQIDATTGASAGPNVATSSNTWTYGGSMQISPDRNTLYYGQYGLSPTTLYKINVSTTTPPTATALTTGSNGQDLTLSHNGNFIAHPNGAPYAITLYRTSDFAALGTLNTGPYPREIAFSPDDQVAYAVHTSGAIDIFSTQTFLPLSPFSTSGEASELSVDQTGRYLFAAFGSVTRVYDTGRVAVPEPGTAGLALIAAGAAAGVRRRRRR